MRECNKNGHVVFDVGLFPSQFIKIGYANYDEECVENLYGVQVGIYNEASGRVTGLNVGVVNVSGEYVDGVNVGLVNVIKGSNGVSVGAVNVTKEQMNGVQISAVNVAGDDMNGLQLSLGNVAEGNLDGVQIGLINSAEKDIRGFHIAPLANKAGKDMEGVQLSLLANTTGSGPFKAVAGSGPFKAVVGEEVGEVAGYSFGSSGEMDGLQLALFNGAEKMYGMQLGAFFNVADDEMKGGQFGALNVSGECKLVNPVYGGVCLFGKKH